MQDLEAVLEASEELRKSPKLKKILEVRMEVSFGLQMTFKTLCALATRSNTDAASIFQFLTTLGKCAVKHPHFGYLYSRDKLWPRKKMFTDIHCNLCTCYLYCWTPLLRGKEHFFWSRNQGLTSISTQNVTDHKEG